MTVPAVKDLSIDDLRNLIRDTVEEALDDRLEDLAALSSGAFLRSFEEARTDHREGRVTPLEDLFDG
jgi:hypothetical protein